MKILLINHFPLSGSGSGIYVKNIARSLIYRGHQACIIMPENTTNIYCYKGVKIHPVYFKRKEQIDGQLDFNFPCMDEHPRSSFLFHKMNKKQIQEYENSFRKAIEEEIKEFKPDAIHTQHIWIISGLLKDYNIPYIITSHGAEFITYKKTNIFDYYGKNAVTGCKKIIAISDDNIEEILSKFPEAKEKIIYLKNGYNATDFYIKEVDKKKTLEKYSINKDYDKIVLYVGRISKMKGIDTLINAAKLYEKENVLTLIAGDGDYRTDMESLSNKLGLKNVYFLGNRNQDELNDLYNIADTLVLPSRKEALPLVAIEAMACGTPSIVTNQSGMEKIITPDVGAIFEMDNEKMLAEKVNDVLYGKIKFNKQKIANHAKSNYSQATLIERLIEIYGEIQGE